MINTHCSIANKHFNEYHQVHVTKQGVAQHTSVMEEVWESTFRGVKGYGAYGPRDVLIIRSSESSGGA